MLTLTISSTKQPRKDIDVYLVPLVDDLKIFQNVGLDMYDTYHRETFTLKTVLLWAINDFPAYVVSCVVILLKHSPSIFRI